MTKIQRQIISSLISGGKLGFLSGTLSDAKGNFIRHVHYRTMRVMERDGMIKISHSSSPSSFVVSETYKEKLSMYKQIDS